MRDYPDNSGWPMIQPFTQILHFHANKEPAFGEPPAVRVQLKKGEALVFRYRNKHASTPNYSLFPRVLYNAVYNC